MTPSPDDDEKIRRLVKQSRSWTCPRCGEFFRFGPGIPRGGEFCMFCDAGEPRDEEGPILPIRRGNGVAAAA